MNVNLMAMIFWPLVLAAAAWFILGMDHASLIRYRSLTPFARGLWRGIAVVSSMGVLAVVGLWGV
jgi:hypothetical protein